MLNPKEREGAREGLGEVVKSVGEERGGGVF